MSPVERARRIADRLDGPPRELVPMGRGTEHAAFAAGPHIVRVVTQLDVAATEGVTREAELLDRLQTRLPVAVPHPSSVHPDLGGFAYRRLPGRPLLDVALVDTSRLTDDLAAFLRAMVGIETAAVSDLVAPDAYPLDAWRDEAVSAALTVSDALTDRERTLIRTFSTRQPPLDRGPVAFCHNDLGAEHLLVDEISGRLLGVLDWSDAALTDPCRDLGRLARDLGPSSLARVLTTAALDPRFVDRDLVTFHAQLATLEDLHHGIATGDRRYTDAARVAFARLFAPPG